MASASIGVDFVADLTRWNSDIPRAASLLDQNTKRMDTSLQRVERGFERVNVSSKQLAFGARQLGFQINDVATQFALGARPMQIFAAQSGQVIQAVQTMTGGTSRLGAFLGGPWGIALTAGALVLVPFISKLFEAEDALEKVEFAAFQFSDAQSILGSVMDLTTGKINTQSDALLALARAQAIAGKIQAQARQAEARSDLNDEAKIRSFITGGFGGGLSIQRGRDVSGDIASALLDGSLNTQEAVAGLESLRKTGFLAEKQFLELAKAVTSFGVETENIKVFEDLEKALAGDKQATAAFLKPAKEGRGRKGPDLEEQARKREAAYQNDLLRLEGQLLSATSRNLVEIEDLADNARQRLDVDRRLTEHAVAQSVASGDLTAAQAKLILERESQIRSQELITINERELADLMVRSLNYQIAVNDNERDLLSAQGALADTQKERREIGLALLQLDRDEETERNQQIINLYKIGRATAEEARIAENRLAVLGQLYDLQEKSLRRATAGPLEAYRDELSKTPDEINEAFDRIRVDGLRNFNDQLVDAIMNFKSLGNVARNVINSIVADLLRLQIQKFLIAPLANLLSGGSNPINLLEGTPYGGGKATGGPVRPGRVYTIGEFGPEKFMPSVPGVIVPNSSSFGAPSMSVPSGFHMNDNTTRVIIEDTTGLFVTRVEQVSSGVVAQAAPALIAAGGEAGVKRINKINSRRLA